MSDVQTDLSALIQNTVTMADAILLSTQDARNAAYPQRYVINLKVWCVMFDVSREKGKQKHIRQRTLILMMTEIFTDYFNSGNLLKYWTLCGKMVHI